MLYRVVNTWNGGKGGRKVEFVSTEHGNDGHNQCFAWLLKHQSMSVYAATHGGGYKIEEVPE